MTTNRTRCALAWLATLLLCATSAAAEGWQDERYHLSMQSPNDWVAMSPELLARTNAQVSHLTGRGFIGGYSLVESTTLVFPYMLVQFKPYASLPEQYRPAAKMSERDRLGLIYALVGAFREKGPLTQDIDTPQFIDRFGSSHATLTRHDDDGRFDFTGKIPHEDGPEPIQYHTHGVFGNDGIALVSVFTVEEFAGLGPVIDNEMRSLKFAEGYGADALPDALPDEPPVVEPEPESTDEPEADAPEATDPETDQADTQEPATNETETLAGEAETDETPTPANTSTGEADATALIIILSLLGVILVAAAFIAWLMAHKKAQAERERRRARRERMQAAQGTTQVENKPRPAGKIKGRSHGSSDRQRRGRTRS